MPEVTRARVAALEVLTRVRTGELADRALATVAGSLDPRDHAWVQELVYGTLRLRGRIDYILGAFVHSGVNRLEPRVLDVLRLGVYQLLAMESVPPYAAVSQAVELVRSAGCPRAAGLVNGVLKAVAREGDAVEFPTIEDDPVAHLTTWGSHPRWLVERWLARWGAAETAALVEANNRRPELYIRPAGIAVEEARERLERAGIDVALVSSFPDSIRIEAPRDAVEALSAVPGVVQDPGAAMVVRYAAFPPGSVVVDISAAPGGKTVGLAPTVAYLVASDISVGRMRRVGTNVARAGLTDRVGLVVADGRMPPFRPVDGVLLDAPCSGTGTFRRRVDSRWRVTPEDLTSLVALQRELLEGAAGVVRSGGHLVYSTCSLEPEENDAQVEWFLDRHPGFHLEAPDVPIDGTMLRGQLLEVLPQRHGVDGAFAARMRRYD